MHGEGQEQLKRLRSCSFARVGDLGDLLWRGESGDPKASAVFAFPPQFSAHKLNKFRIGRQKLKS